MKVWFGVNWARFSADMAENVFCCRCFEFFVKIMKKQAIYCQMLMSENAENLISSRSDGSLLVCKNEDAFLFNYIFVTTI